MRYREAWDTVDGCSSLRGGDADVYNTFRALSFWYVRYIPHRPGYWNQAIVLHKSKTPSNALILWRSFYFQTILSSRSSASLLYLKYTSAPGFCQYLPTKKLHASAPHQFLCFTWFTAAQITSVPATVISELMKSSVLTEAISSILPPNTHC